MASCKGSRQKRAKLLSLLLALAMLFSMIPATFAEESKGTVHVVVENTTFTEKMNGKTPAWTGELVNTDVELSADSTMMTCIVAALATVDTTPTIVESKYGRYITEVGGIAEKDAADASGWMGTLNDWFSSTTFDEVTVANGSLTAGDEIRVMYTCDLGTDLGSDYNSTDKTVKAVAFSAGSLDKAFAADTHEYTLSVPEGTESVVVTPTAANRNYQVHTYVGETEYKRTASVPVAVGTVITVKCGDPAWPSMNNNTGDAQVYTFTVAQEVPHTPITANVTFSNASAFMKDKNGADTVNMKVQLDTKLEYTVNDILTAAHEQFCADGADGFATATGDYGEYITKLWGVETSNVGYYLNGAMVYALTDKVQNGDFLDVFIYANAYPDTEAYAAFDKATVDTDDETSFELTLKSAVFDENYNMSMVPCEGATITVDGVKTTAVTDAEGKATVKITTVGTHVVSAVKTKTVGEGDAAKEISAITAPACVATVAATAIDSGKYGNVVWKLREDGTLEFSAVEGSDGKMGGSISKWSLPTYTKKYNEQIKSIVVKEGVTSIVNYAFYAMSAVTSVSLPSTLASIGDDAFSGVTTITSFTCAEGCVLSVKDNFVLKNNGTEIFTYLGKMEGVITIPDGVTKVGALFGGSEITGIIFPDSVTEISGTNYTTWDGPFAGCTKLESVTIPCNITQTYVFKNCTALKTVSFKEGVTTMADYTFSNCTALTTINIPKSMDAFNTSAFVGCKAISTINCAEGSIYSMKDNVLMKNGTEIVFALPTVQVTGELVIPEGVTAIGDYAYEKQTGVTSVKFPSTLKTVGKFAFSGCTGLTGEVVFPEGVTTIGREAFHNCAGVTGVQFPSTLTTIGQQAFDNTGLTALELPASVTSIDYGAFQKTKIKTLNLPDGLNITASSVFQECTELTEISVGGDVTGNGAFGDCTALTTVTVREGATSIGSRAFSGCTALTTVNLPKSLTTLDAQAFYGCTALKSINFAEGSTFRFQDGIVYSGNSILFVLTLDQEELVIADGVTEIGKQAFQKQTVLKKVTLPDSLVKIGNSAFKGCTNLASINLPKNLEEIGSTAFNNCTSLPMVTFPASLKTIGSQAFKGCTNMKGRLYLPGTITSFGAYAFQDCSGITSVYFEDAVDPENTTYGEQLLRECVNLTDLRLPENMTKLNSMIYHCYGLRKLVLPENIKEFARDDYLPDGFVYMDLKGIQKFSTYTMSNMSNLKELYLSADLTDYPDSGRNCHPDIIYFRGTEEQWNAVKFGTNTLANFEKYGTVIVFNYGSETGDAPEITKQPESATYEQGLRPSPLTIEVNELEGAQYVYHWFCDGEFVASGKECAISTGTPGAHEYYCMVRCVVNGKYSETKSDVVTVTVAAVEKPFEGEGTEEDPYQLSKWQDLERLSVLVESGESYKDKFFLMTADITLPKNWKPIGCTKDGSNGINKGANLNAFSGTFDGGNHLLTVPAGERPLFAYVNGTTIRNLNIYGTQINGFGLVDCFTGVGMSGTAMIIENITLKSGTQTLESGLIGARRFENGWAGCSAGYNAIIRNCTIEKGVIIGYTGDRSEIGGFAGRMQGTVENCVNNGTVKGVNYVGGIVATIDNALGKCDVLNCTFGGDVIASGKNVGGIVGSGYCVDTSAPNGMKITVENCTSTGVITGDTNVGGILGGEVCVAQSWDNVKYSFKNNTFTGKVAGNKNVGAIIGYYKSLNRVDDISGNQYAKNCGATQPVGAVYVVDTNCAEPTAYGDTIYCNTESGTSSCPTVAGCSWKTGYNRTDDPLGKDVSKLFAVIGAVKLGDLNGDGEVDITDAGILVQYCNDVIELTSDQLQAADLNGDGEVDITDAGILVQFCNDLITEF